MWVTTCWTKSVLQGEILGKHSHNRRMQVRKLCWWQYFGVCCVCFAAVNMFANVMMRNLFERTDVSFKPFRILCKVALFPRKRFKEQKKNQRKEDHKKSQALRGSFYVLSDCFASHEKTGAAQMCRTWSQIRGAKILWIILICWDVPVRAYVHRKPAAGFLPFPNSPWGWR